MTFSTVPQKNTHNFYKYWDISAVYDALCRNPGRHLRHMESPWSHLHVCYEQSFTTCCSLEAGLRENVEWKRKWRENGERMRKWKGNWERNTKAKQFLPHFFCLKVAEIFVCRCYSSGERLCRRQAVQFGFSQDDIDQCKLVTLRVMVCFCKIFLENSVLIFLTGIAEPGAAQGE